MCYSANWLLVEPKTLIPWKKSYDQPRQHIKKQRHYFANKGPSSQGYGFPVVMYGYESWTIKKAECWRTDAPTVLEKTPESSLDCKEIQPVNPKGNQSWLFTGRTYVEAETPILCPPDAENWLIGKDPDAGKDRRQEKGTEDEMVRWHHWLDGHEFEEAPGVADGQGSLVCCSPWRHKESDTTEWVNWCLPEFLSLYSSSLELGQKETCGRSGGQKWISGHCPLAVFEVIYDDGWMQI